MNKNTGLALLLVGAMACGRAQKTNDLASPDYWLENYRDFLQQKSAITQVENTIKMDEDRVAAYRKEMAGVPRAAWPRQFEENMEERETILQAHVSQYNMLVAQYNARASDVTKKLVDTKVEAKIPYKDELRELANTHYTPK